MSDQEFMLIKLDTDIHQILVKNVINPWRYDKFFKTRVQELTRIFVEKARFYDINPNSETRHLEILVNEGLSEFVHGVFGFI